MRDVLDRVFPMTKRGLTVYYCPGTVNYYASLEDAINRTNGYIYLFEALEVVRELEKSIPRPADGRGAGT